MIATKIFLAKRFIEGKRLLYLHPAQMYLFISVVFFFLLSVTVVRNQVETLDQSPLRKPKGNEMGLPEPWEYDNIENELDDENVYLD